jgi:hypothetical protein
MKSQSLANLSGGVAYDGVQIGVIVRRPAEDVDPDCAFFEFVSVAEQSLFHDVPQKGRIALAVTEVGALKNVFESAQNLSVFFRRGRNPSLSFWGY